MPRPCGRRSPWALEARREAGHRPRKVRPPCLSEQVSLNEGPERQKALSRPATYTPVAREGRCCDSQKCSVPAGKMVLYSH